MKKLNSLMFIPAVCVLLSLPVSSSPLFSLDTEAEWQTAITNGNVSAVEDPYAALAHYGTAGVDYVQYTPNIFALNNAESGGLGDGLLMAWGSGSDTTGLPQVAAWEYVYGADPDLTGTLLSLSVMPPSGILSVSLTLTDINGAWMSWFWDVFPPLPGPTGVASGASTVITLDPTVHANQANSTAFVDSGFNHLLAISITADELVGAPPYTSFPASPLASPGAPVWNYWSGLTVFPNPVPVPGALLLFCSSLLGFVAVKKRR